MTHEEHCSRLERKADVIISLLERLLVASAVIGDGVAALVEVFKPTPPVAVSAAIVLGTPTLESPVPESPVVMP